MAAINDCIDIQSVFEKQEFAAVNFSVDVSLKSLLVLAYS